MTSTTTSSATRGGPVTPSTGGSPPAVARHRDDIALGVATLAATAPILVAAVRGAAGGWLPVGDDAYAAIRGRDVFSRHPPLLGTWSSASQWAHRQINHPGPLQFDLAAVPVRLFGPGWGLALATAGVNIVCLLGVAWLSRHIVGPKAATVTMLFATGLVWAIGSEILYDPWSQYAPVLPFLVFLFAAWAAAAGRSQALPVLAVAGSYALQTHLSYVVLVPALATWALVAWGLARLRDRRDPNPYPNVEVDDGKPVRSARRSHRLWAAVALAAIMACWAQPLYQQVTSHPGNVSELVASAGAKSPPTPGPKGALQAVGNVVAIPPFWLPPTWASPPFYQKGTGRPPALLVGALLALDAGGAVLAVLARRCHDRVVVAGLITAALAGAAGWVGAAKATSPYGLVASYVRWLWPISMFVWTVLVLAAVRLLRVHGPSRLRERTSSIAAALALLSVAASALALPTADHGTVAPRWAMAVAKDITAQAVPRLAGRGPVVVRLPISLVTFNVGPALFTALQRHGISFVVDDPDLVAQLGPERRFNGSNARLTVTVVGGETARRPPAAYERIAYAPALSRAELHTMRALTPVIRARLRELGRIPLDPVALARLPVIGQYANLRDAKKVARNFSFLSGQVHEGLVDVDRFGEPELRRWADLTWRFQNQSVAVLISPVARRHPPRPVG